jgi:hypothetical protein
MRLGFLAVALVATTGAAQAQDACRIIAKYFVDAPSAFIAERGEQISEGKWKSKYTLVNASCEISHLGFHTISCYFNEGKSDAEVRQFFKDVEEAITGCLSQMPNGSDYKKEIEQENSAMGVRVASRWLYRSPSATYIIRVGGGRRSTGTHYNFMWLSYRSR